ncbi:MAG: tRNA-dihydrouridine synthase [Candidatus Absconditabacterales bacterium]
MSVEGYVRHPEKLSRHLLTTQGQYPVVAQIYGGDHDNLLQTAVDIDHKYKEFEGIELNIGCPSPRIMSCEAGSGMLRCRPKTLNIIKTISSSIRKPFSIKTRAGLTQEDKQEQFDFIIESAYHCRMITVHGRTYKQSHSGEVDRDFIIKVKHELIRRDLRDVIIIGNGGLKSVDDGLGYLNELDGIMLGQAAMNSPWTLTNYSPSIEELYAHTLRHLHLNLANERYFNYSDSFDTNTNTLQQPSQDTLQTIIHNIQNGTNNAEQIGEYKKRHSLIEFRKHLFRYVTGLPGNAEFKRSVAVIEQYEPLLETIHNYFRSLPKTGQQ